MKDTLVIDQCLYHSVMDPVAMGSQFGRDPQQGRGIIAPALDQPAFPVRKGGADGTECLDQVRNLPDAGRLVAFQDDRDPAPEQVETQQEIVVGDLVGGGDSPVQGILEPEQLDLGGNKYPCARPVGRELKLLFLADLQPHHDDEGDEQEPGDGRQDAPDPSPPGHHLTSRRFSCQIILL